MRTPDVIDRLERDLGVPVRIRTGGDATSEPADATPAWTWEVWVGDEAITTVDRRRDGEGYTVYETSSSRFERLVRSAVDQRHGVGDETCDE